MTLLLNQLSYRSEAIGSHVTPLLMQWPDLSQPAVPFASTTGPDWQLAPFGSLKEGGLAPSGLKNQGSTCYMNSFLQVLASSQFRDPLLSCTSAQADPLVDQMRALFARIYHSNRSIIDTYSFCCAVPASLEQQMALEESPNPLPKDGPQFSLNEQRDVSEFAVQLFDLLEERLQLWNTPDQQTAKSLLNLFSGTTVQQVWFFWFFFCG